MLCVLGPRPIAPPPFNEDEVRGELIDYYSVYHRKPGDPKLIPQLSSHHHPSRQNITRYMRVC